MQNFDMSRVAPQCVRCRTPLVRDTTFRCSSCNVHPALYCSTSCQHAHWPAHKYACESVVGAHNYALDDVEPNGPDAANNGGGGGGGGGGGSSSSGDKTCSGGLDGNNDDDQSATYDRNEFDSEETRAYRTKWLRLRALVASTAEAAAAKNSDANDGASDELHEAIEGAAAADLRKDLARHRLSAAQQYLDEMRQATSYAQDRDAERAAAIGAILDNADAARASAPLAPRAFSEAALGTATEFIDDVLGLEPLSDTPGAAAPAAASSPQNVPRSRQLKASGDGLFPLERDARALAEASMHELERRVERDVYERVDSVRRGIELFADRQLEFARVPNTRALRALERDHDLLLADLVAAGKALGALPDAPDYAAEATERVAKHGGTAADHLSKALHDDSRVAMHMFMLQHDATLYLDPARLTDDTNALIDELEAQVAAKSAARNNTRATTAASFGLKVYARSAAAHVEDDVLVADALLVAAELQKSEVRENLDAVFEQAAAAAAAAEKARLKDSATVAAGGATSATEATRRAAVASGDASTDTLPRAAPLASQVGGGGGSGDEGPAATSNATDTDPFAAELARLMAGHPHGDAKESLGVLMRRVRAEVVARNATENVELRELLNVLDRALRAIGDLNEIEVEGRDAMTEGVSLTAAQVRQIASRDRTKRDMLMRNLRVANGGAGVSPEARNAIARRQRSVCTLSARIVTGCFMLTAALAPLLGGNTGAAETTLAAMAPVAIPTALRPYSFEVAALLAQDAALADDNDATSALPPVDTQQRSTASVLAEAANTLFPREGADGGGDAADAPQPPPTRSMHPLAASVVAQAHWVKMTRGSGGGGDNENGNAASDALMFAANVVEAATVAPQLFKGADEQLLQSAVQSLGAANGNALIRAALQRAAVVLIDISDGLSTRATINALNTADRPRYQQYSDAVEDVQAHIDKKLRPSVRALLDATEQWAEQQQQQQEGGAGAQTSPRGSNTVEELRQDAVEAFRTLQDKIADSRLNEEAASALRADALRNVIDSAARLLEADSDEAAREVLDSAESRALIDEFVSRSVENAAAAAASPPDSDERRALEPSTRFVTWMRRLQDTLARYVSSATPTAAPASLRAQLEQFSDRLRVAIGQDTRFVADASKLGDTRDSRRRFARERTFELLAVANAQAQSGRASATATQHSLLVRVLDTLAEQINGERPFAATAETLRTLAAQDGVATHASLVGLGTPGAAADVSGAMFWTGTVNAEASRAAFASNLAVLRAAAARVVGDVADELRIVEFSRTLTAFANTQAALNKTFILIMGFLAILIPTGGVTLADVLNLWWRYRRSVVEAALGDIRRLSDATLEQIATTRQLFTAGQLGVSTPDTREDKLRLLDAMSEGVTERRVESERRLRAYYDFFMTNSFLRTVAQLASQGVATASGLTLFATGYAHLVQHACLDAATLHTTGPLYGAAPALILSAANAYATTTLIQTAKARTVAATVAQERLATNADFRIEDRASSAIRAMGNARFANVFAIDAATLGGAMAAALSSPMPEAAGWLIAMVSVATVAYSALLTFVHAFTMRSVQARVFDASTRERRTRRQ